MLSSKDEMMALNADNDFLRLMEKKWVDCLSFITMSGLLAFISQSVCIGISHKIVMLSLSVTVWGSCSYHLSSTYI